MASSRDKLRKKSQETKQVAPTVRDNDALRAVIEKNQRKEIIIDPVLQSLIPPLQAEELALLEASIREEGVREPLILWQSTADAGTNLYTLVDGHNRYETIRKLEAELGVGAVKYQEKVLDFPDFEAVKDWMILNQLGRRNLTDEQRSYLRGLRYEREKSRHGGERSTAEKASPQNGNLKTHERLSDEYKVSKNTILRDAEFARGVEKIGEQNLQLKREILSGQVRVKKGDLQMLGKVEEAVPAANVQEVQAFIREMREKERGGAPAEKRDLAAELKGEIIQKIKFLGPDSHIQDYQKIQAMLDKLAKQYAKKPKKA
jgi:ParB-like nuclease domain